MRLTRSEIQEKIKKACVKAHRNIEEVKLVAVSKKQSAEKMREIYSEGQRIFAENYVQEFLEKQKELPQDIKWHMIGPLQKNKINKIIGLFDLVHSVHDLEIAKIIAEKTNKKQKILLQVNLAGEDSKSGFSEKDIIASTLEISQFQGLEVCGLMTMPPFVEDPESSRPYFRRLCELKKELQKSVPTMRELSMGTTQDFMVAVEEGATLVRIGEALFGPRER